jgi:beta-lactamase regulating signal transducer with metallopeptidase domain
MKNDYITPDQRLVHTRDHIDSSDIWFKWFLIIAAMFFAFEIAKAALV